MKRLRKWWGLRKLMKLEARIELLAVQIQASHATELDGLFPIEEWQAEAQRLEFECYMLRYKLFGARPVVPVLKALQGGKAEDVGAEA